MASNNEAGNARNAAHFLTLIEYLKTLNYNPTKPEIFITALGPVQAQCELLVKEIAEELLPLYNNTTVAQKIAFDKIPKLSTKMVLAYLQVCDDPAAAQRAINLGKELKPARTKKSAANEGGPAKDGVSTSHRSYDNQVANFNSLIGILKLNPKYHPNEEELKIVNLEAFAAQLQALTEAVDAPEQALRNKRIARDILMFKPQSGQIALVDSIKGYVASVYGARSPEMKYINSLKFKRNP